MPSISIMSRGATFALAFLLGDAADGASSLRGAQEYSNESAFVHLARATHNFCVGPDHKWRCETPCEFASQPCIDNYGAGSDCWVDQLRECSSVTPPPSGAMGEVVATYIAARPSNLLPPPLSSIPSEVNLVMVCFAKNSPTGHFVSYDPQLWRSLDIGGNKRSPPRRKFLISLGGAAAWGGRFEIRGSLDVWVSNAVRSVEALIKEYSADGAEMQWEGNTGHSLFQPAVTRLLAELKGRGYTTATGPFYGGTSRDYAKLPLDNVDYINMQMYAMNIQSVDRLARGVEAAIAEYPVGSRATARAKFVLGLNSDNRNPNPKVGLTTLKSVGSIAGVFTWDAEHSATTMQPHWCIERLGAQILRGGSPSIDCRWR
mmetsp:Transcript_18635/g.51322  ORF Transcript_18635/g.51322 Transcript_18635/m.51322 type:complete len:373 (-) Transcript_18635:264-1382(-)